MTPLNNPKRYTPSLIDYCVLVLLKFADGFARVGVF
jgi:hypothetical protein